MPIKYLNLDELATAPQRFLKFQGVEHAIVEQTVDGFIEATRLVEELNAQAEQDMIGQLDVTIKLIMLAVPTIDASALKSRPLATLGRIARFVRGEDEEEAQVEGESEKK